MIELDFQFIALTNNDRKHNLSVFLSIYRIFKKPSSIPGTGRVHGFLGLKLIQFEFDTKIQVNLLIVKFKLKIL